MFCLLSIFALLLAVALPLLLALALLLALPLPLLLALALPLAYLVAQCRFFFFQAGYTRQRDTF